jgi:hypothetical protein
MLARLNDAQPAPTAAAVGVLRVLGGGPDNPEYNLAAHTSLIGKGESSLVRLNGWFKPDMAVAITRNDQGYIATPLGGKTLINGEPLRNRQGLKNGDVLRVSGLMLEFRVRG